MADNERRFLRSAYTQRATVAAELASVSTLASTLTSARAWGRALVPAFVPAWMPVWALAGIVLALGPTVASAQIPGEPDPIRPGQAAPDGSYGDLDVLHYQVKITLPEPGSTVIQGNATVTFRLARAGVAEAILDFTGLSLLAVTLDGVPVNAWYEAGRLGVPLPLDLSPDDTLRLGIQYQGTPDDGLILQANVHGHPSAFVDNWPNRTRFWLPSVDHPSDKATASITVEAPASWVVVSNGRQVGRPEAAPPHPDGSHRLAWRWETQAPVSPYNLVFGAAEMEVKPLGFAACGSAPLSPRPDGCLEVTAWLFPEDTAQADLSFRRAADMVDFFTNLVGPFPFEKLAHVQSSTRFGGMENASAIFYSERALASGRNIEGTVAHETAHQWFGDQVTEARWPEIWLSEGFGTYFGHLYFEEIEGEERFRELMQQDRRAVLASPDVSRPVIDWAVSDLFDLLNDNTYPKAGWVLHMLRGMLGDEVFFRGIRRYYAEFGGKSATTADFRASMEAESGEDLAWFFHQWLEAPGFPRLSVEDSWDGDAGEAVVVVRQHPKDGWPVFRLPMEVAVVASDGASTRSPVEIRGRETIVRIPAGAPPSAIVLDPDGWVLWEEYTPGSAPAVSGMASPHGSAGSTNESDPAHE